MADNKVSKPTKGGVPSRDQMYRKIAMKAFYLIDYLMDVINGKLPASAVRIGAAKTLLNKALPDLRAMEVTGKDGQQFTITVVTGDSDTRKGFTPPSTGGAVTGQPPIQGSSLAPKGT